MKKPKAIEIFLDTVEQFSALSDEQAGKVIKALLHFANTDEDCRIEGDPTADIFYIGIRKQIERDFAKYRRRCEVNRRNARRGGAPVGNQNARRYDPADSAPAGSVSSSAKTTETTQYEEKDEHEYKHEEKNEHEYENKNEEKEKNENQKQPNLSEQQKKSCSEEVYSLFLSLCPGLSGDLSDLADSESVDRIKALSGFQGFADLFRRVRRSDFLSGRSGKWRGCTLSWILAPNNAVRILQGAYDNPSGRLGGFCRTGESSHDLSRHKSLFD